LNEIALVNKNYRFQDLKILPAMAVRQKSSWLALLEFET